MKVGIMALSVDIMWNTKRLLQLCGSFLCVDGSSMGKLIISSGISLPTKAY